MHFLMRVSLVALLVTTGGCLRLMGFPDEKATNINRQWHSSPAYSLSKEDARNALMGRRVRASAAVGLCTVDSVSGSALTYERQVEVTDSASWTGMERKWHYENRRAGTLNFADVTKIDLVADYNLIKLYGSDGRQLLTITDETGEDNRLLSALLVLCPNVR